MVPVGLGLFLLVRVPGTPQLPTWRMLAAVALLELVWLGGRWAGRPDK